MSAVDALLARSRSPGTFVERRTFTLSRKKAIEKQREFALRHPAQYVLELIQVAVLSGATYIAVESHPERLLIAWVGGKTLQAQELSNLMDYLFADRGDEATRTLVQLAVGINALLQRNPAEVLIESGNGENTIRMNLKPNGEGEVGIVEETISGTYISAKFRQGWFQRIAGNIHTDESHLIEERCMYAPIPILLNGRAPFGYRASKHIEIFGARKQHNFHQKERRGVMAVHHSAEVTGYRIVVGGVWISTLKLNELTTPPSVGVICDDNLRKTADHSDIVQDDRFIDLLHDLQPIATQMMREMYGADYQPPRLPPRAAPKPSKRIVQAEEPVHLEPLPDLLICPAPRMSRSLEDLQELHSRCPDLPVFWSETETLQELGSSVQPHNFPYPIVELTEGQAATLQAELPTLQLSQLSGQADVDFVRRVRERSDPIHEHHFRVGGHRVTLQHHASASRPNWGEGRVGTPWICISKGETTGAGVAKDGQVHTVTDVPDHQRITSTPHAQDLPGISVRIDQHANGDVDPSDLWRQVVQEAWTMAVPVDRPHNSALLATLMGMTGTVRLVQDPEPGVQLSLTTMPIESVQSLPLTRDEQGKDVRLVDLLELWGTDQTLALESPEALRSLAHLEHLLGHGHLTTAGQSNTLVLALSAVHGRWTLRHPSEISPSDTEVVALTRTREPMDTDGVWVQTPDSEPLPHVVQLVRDSLKSRTPGGLDALYAVLVDLDHRFAWGEYATEMLPTDAIRDAGRVALFALSAGQTEEAQLTPTDGGAAVPLGRVIDNPQRRLVARRGIHLAEPHTFALTIDEWVALGVERIPLRFDDPPEVWSVTQPHSEQGWLIRQEVQEADLEGWMGLRHPYDSTTGLLIRDGTHLLALPEVEGNTPCHGMLWPSEPSAHTPGPSGRQLLHLAGLKLYESLTTLLSGDLDDERRVTAEAYAIAYCVRGYRSGKRRPGQQAMARQVRILDEEGHPWGTLAQWLDTDPESRPPLPIDVPEQLADEPKSVTSGADTDLTDRASEIGISGAMTRLAEALRMAPGTIMIRRADERAEWGVSYLASHSTKRTVVLLCNMRHPLNKIGMMQAGFHHELWLMECARAICTRHTLNTSLPSFEEAQQRLVMQRLAAD